MPIIPEDPKRVMHIEMDKYVLNRCTFMSAIELDEPFALESLHFLKRAKLAPLKINLSGRVHTGENRQFPWIERESDFSIFTKKMEETLLENEKRYKFQVLDKIWKRKIDISSALLRFDDKLFIIEDTVTGDMFDFIVSSFHKCVYLIFSKKQINDYKTFIDFILVISKTFHSLFKIIEFDLKKIRSIQDIKGLEGNFDVLIINYVKFPGPYGSESVIGTFKSIHKDKYEMTFWPLSDKDHLSILDKKSGERFKIGFDRDKLENRSVDKRKIYFYPSEGIHNETIINFINSLYDVFETCFLHYFLVPLSKWINLI